MVEEQKLDPAKIAGSGKDGRITKGDVVEYQSKGRPPLPQRNPRLPFPLRRPCPALRAGRTSACR